MADELATQMEGKPAMELFAMGVRSYRTMKYQDAATLLTKASEMLVEEHKDDKHDILGNVYLTYGKTLLELARAEGDPLGDAVPKEVGLEDSGEEDEEGSSDNKEGEEEDGDAANESKTEEEDGKEKEKEEKEKENSEDEANKTDDAKAEVDENMKQDVPKILLNGEPLNTSTAALENCLLGGSMLEGSMLEGSDDEAEQEEEGEDIEEDAGEGGSGEEKKEEEPSDLQLAWEVLELAKLILERRGEKGKEDYSDCLVTLGEVSLESENFDSAISDITAGLEIQKELYKESKDMRKLAETYYKLALALSSNNSIEESVSHYHKTLEILKDRLKVLEEIEAPGVTDLTEITEIKTLIPDLDDKINDLKSYKEEMIKKQEEEKPVASSPEKKANNITHLVKRKRKLEDVAEEAAAIAAKKAAP